MNRVRALRDDEREWVRTFMRDHWAGETVVVHGVIYEPSTLPGLVAIDDAGERVGLVTYLIEGASCEIVTIDAFVPRSGHGRAMVDAVVAVARDAGCTRLWLITTNDNVRAQAFYRAIGFEVTAIRPGAVDDSRKLKPSIPLVSEDGVPITDEVELERRL
jgi:ribosomal protein S18 acetylase RimI-like enzyme